MAVRCLRWHFWLLLCKNVCPELCIQKTFPYRNDANIFMKNFSKDKKKRNSFRLKEIVVYIKNAQIQFLIQICNKFASSTSPDIYHQIFHLVLLWIDDLILRISRQRNCWSLGCRRKKYFLTRVGEVSVQTQIKGLCL